MELNTKFNSAKVFPAVLLILLGITLVVAACAVWEMINAPKQIQTEQTSDTKQSVENEEFIATSSTDDSASKEEEIFPSSSEENVVKTQVSTNDELLKKVFLEQDVEYKLFVSVNELLKESAGVQTYSAVIINAPYPDTNLSIIIQSKDVSLQVGNNHVLFILHDSKTDSYVVKKGLVIPVIHD